MREEVGLVKENAGAGSMCVLGRRRCLNKTSLEERTMEVRLIRREKSGHEGNIRGQE